MIKFEKTEVFNFNGAIRGMRNSWESHDKSDSYWDKDTNDIWYYVIGKNDLKLAKQLAKAGGSHAKFLRQILVCVDIDAPLYWWKEFDQYKVGTVTNSESTMHTIQRNQIDTDLFSFDIPEDMKESTQFVMNILEEARKKFIETKDKKYWKILIQLLPSGWMQKRTTTLNYQVIANAYHDRKHHRLTEWHDFCDWAESLPYSEIITLKDDE